MWENNLNSDRLPNTGTFLTYTFDETPISQYTPININKEQVNYIRVCAYNTLESGLGSDERRPHFEKIIKALNPDIIAFQENSVDYITLKSYLDSWLPLNTPNGWYVYYDTASKWEITSYWTNFPDDNPPDYRQSAALIDLPASYEKDLLLVNSHLDFGTHNAERQHQINGWNNFLSYAKTPGGNIDLPENTPIIYLGDLNLVGYAQQLTSLITGIDEYGNGFPPDWDDTDLENTTALQTDKRMAYTWRKDGSGGGFVPGKLDYILYSGSILNEEKSFVLQTEIMPTDRLTVYNLEQNNTHLASDHFPIVAEFSFNSNLSIPNNSLDIFTMYPNPIKNNLNINFKNNGVKRVRVFSIIGTVLYEKETDQLYLEINFSNLESGLYIIKIQDENGKIKTEKFIKK